MFYKTPLRRMRSLLRNVRIFKKMYYGKLYLSPLTVRCGNITEYTQYIRNSIIAITHDGSMGNYKIETYANLHTWLNGADVVKSITLLLESMCELDECLNTVPEDKKVRHRILIELPVECVVIVERLEQICVELKKL